MSRILITGGAGYIGSMLSTELVRAGHKVTVVDLMKYKKDSLNHLFFNKNFKLVKKDVGNNKIIKNLLRNHEYIIPLAALVGAPLCQKNKKEALKVNYISIKNLVSMCPSKNKIIFLSSNSGYGVGAKNKFCDENSPMNPVSLYGKTKCDAENEVKKHKNHVCFRLATVFGFSHRMRSDLLVNNFVYDSVKNKKITVFEPYFRRNFIHVLDVVEGIVFAIKNFNKLKSNVYNLGLSSANISKIMLAKKIKKQQKDIKIKIVKNRKDPDKRDYLVSNKKLENLGWKAKYSLDSGISELIKCYSMFKKNNFGNI